MLRSALGSALRAARAQAPRWAPDPGSTCMWVPALRNSVKPDDASHRLGCTASGTRQLQRHHDLAEMPVGFHVLERLSDIVERKHLVDRQLQFAGFHRGPDILADFIKDLADFLDRTGTEGNADIVDPARGMQVKVEISMCAAEPADIDNAAFYLCGGKILVGNLARDLIDDQIDAFAGGRLQHGIDPAGIAGIDREVGAEIPQ